MIVVIRASSILSRAINSPQEFSWDCEGTLSVLDKTQFSLMWRIFVLLAFVPHIVAITNARILLARRHVLGSRLFNLATIIDPARRAENAPHTNFYFLPNVL